MSSEPDFLTVAEVLELHVQALARYGGSDGLRDEALLESAVATPAATFGGELLLASSRARSRSAAGELSRAGTGRSRAPHRHMAMIIVWSTACAGRFDPLSARSISASSSSQRSTVPGGSARCVYASADYGDALTKLSAVKSMSRPEYADYLTRGAAIASIGDYIDGFYNPRRRHSAIGYVSPNRI